MRRDNRERRVRNTLTVDLGISGLPLLDSCMDAVGTFRRARGKVSGSPLKRGQVIGIALKCLHLVIQGVNDPLSKALAYERAMRGN